MQYSTVPIVYHMHVYSIICQLIVMKPDSPSGRLPHLPMQTRKEQLDCDVYIPSRIVTDHVDGAGWSTNMDTWHAHPLTNS